VRAATKPPRFGSKAREAVSILIRPAVDWPATLRYFHNTAHHGDMKRMRDPTSLLLADICE
jgi:hypothetical protein